MSFRCAMLIHPPTVTANAPLRDAIAVLADSAAPGCVVVLSTADTQGGANRVVGLLTESDVVRWVAQGSPLDLSAVDQAMTQPVMTLRQSVIDDAEAVANYLHQHNLRYLPVVDEGDRLVGLVTAQSLHGIILNITDRVNAEQENRQRTEREILLKEITQRIRQSLDLQTIFDTACAEIRQVLRADRVGVFRFAPDSRWNQGEFVAEAVVDLFPSALNLNIHDHCFGEKYAPLYLQGRYAAMANVYDLDQCHTDVLSIIQVQANLVMPLITDQGLWGLLCIHQCTGPRQWQPGEIDFTQQLANQLAIAINQGNLFQQLQQELIERQKAQQQLTERNDELARATRLKDEFLANMSHELRTPLNAILGMAEGLQDDIFGAVSDRQRQAIQTIDRSGTHLLELINDILDLSKIEAGRVELEVHPTAIVPLCSASMAFVRQQALQKQIQLNGVLPADLPEVLIDDRRVRQVLINLLSNAVKFTPPGGTITLAVSREWQVPPHFDHIRHVHRSPSTGPAPHLAELSSDGLAPDYLFVSVLDTGIGIAATHLEQLFQPFVQVESALNRQYAGTGLGLALVQRIVALHGGLVSVASEPGVGSYFVFSLPCVPRAMASTIDLAPALPRVQPSGGLAAPTRSAVVLLVEDNEANVMTLSSYLKAKGFTLILAKNGQEAIDLNQTHHPDMILMDIQMPVMDGLEAMRHIRQDDRFVATPIIALTSLAMLGDHDRCLAAGATAYLSKPVKMKQLVSTMQALLHPENASLTTHD